MMRIRVTAKRMLDHDDPVADIGLVAEVFRAVPERSGKRQTHFSQVKSSIDVYRTV